MLGTYWLHDNLGIAHRVANSFASSLAFVVGFGQIAGGTARPEHWELGHL